MACDLNIKKPRVIASKVTNRDNSTWDLTQYQGNGIGTPGARWRLWERSHSNINYPSGVINEMGKLEGLADKFVSSYDYDGYMELQQYVYDEATDTTIYP